MGQSKDIRSSFTLTRIILYKLRVCRFAKEHGPRNTEWKAKWFGWWDGDPTASVISSSSDSTADLFMIDKANSIVLGKQIISNEV